MQTTLHEYHPSTRQSPKYQLSRMPGSSRHRESWYGAVWKNHCIANKTGKFAKSGATDNTNIGLGINLGEDKVCCWLKRHAREWIRRIRRAEA